MLSLLLIDDDPNLRRVTELQLNDLGYKVKTADSGEEGLKMVRNDNFDVVVTDVVMPGIDGMEVLKRLNSEFPELIVIIMTAFATLDSALIACDDGASDYIVKPFGIQQLVFAIEKAAKFRKLEEKAIRLESQLKDKFRLENIVGGSSKMQDIFRLVDKVAKSNSTVMILGESGTGKELVAKAIHFGSSRAKNNFVTVNCAAIPENLMESELFGHEEGAFTGAVKSRVGKFEQANGGTIFLDEIGDLKDDLQAKLLRVLQEREIQKVGSDETISLDIKIIAATNQNLESKIKEGTFREDLYYRLSVIPILLPPLREREGDIPDLIDHFIRKYSGDKAIKIEDSAKTLLLSYKYPGNVRELENMIERAITLSDGDVITSDEIMSYLKSNTYPADSEESPKQGTTLNEIERKVIVDALVSNNWNQTKAAKLLDIPRHVLLYRIKKYNIFWVQVVSATRDVSPKNT